MTEAEKLADAILMMAEANKGLVRSELVELIGRFDVCDSGMEHDEEPYTPRPADPEDTAFRTAYTERMIATAKALEDLMDGGAMDAEMLEQVMLHQAECLARAINPPVLVKVSK